MASAAAFALAFTIAITMAFVAAHTEYTDAVLAGDTPVPPQLVTAGQWRKPVEC